MRTGARRAKRASRARGVNAVAMVLLLVASASSLLHAQPQLPAGEQEPQAEEAAVPYVSAQRQWRALRYSSQPFEELEWNTLLARTRRLYEVREELVDSEDPTQRAAEIEYVAEGMLVIRERLRARLRTDETLMRQAGYQQLRGFLSDLRELGASDDELETILHDWLELSDWRERASFADLLRLAENELAVEEGPVVAVRWTGYLTSLPGGRFTLEQARQMVGDLSGRVWVNGRLVLDTVAQRREVTEYNQQQELRRQAERRSLGRFLSDQVVLWPARPVPIRVELVLDEEQMQRVRQADWDFGMVLLWESEETPLEVIPHSAFTPPADFANPGDHGLKAEYFRDAAMLESVDTRLDPALDRLCTAGPWLPRYAQRRAEVLAICLDRLLEEGFLAGLNEEERRELAGAQLVRLAAQLRMEGRAKVLGWLLEHQELWQQLDEQQIAGLVDVFYPLPDKEHLKVVGEWSLMRPLPQAQLGELVLDWRADFYVNNIWQFVHLGNQFQNVYYEDTNTLLDEYLMREDGSCNLPLAYAFIFSSYDAGFSATQTFLARLNEVIEGGQVTGDALATWLMARAYAKQIFVSGQPRLIRAMPDLESAFLIAESTEVQFWVLREMMVRYLAMRGGDRATGLLAEFAQDFPAPEHQQQIELWHAQLEFVAALAPLYDAWQEVSSFENSLRVFREQLENARAHNRPDGIAESENRIEMYERMLVEAQAAYDEVHAQAQALLPAARGEAAGTGVGEAESSAETAP